MKRKLFFLTYFIFSIQYSFADDSIDLCKIKDLEEYVHELNYDIDRLKFYEDESLKKEIIEINGAIGDIFQQFIDLPEDCQNVSVKIREFVRDIKLLHQCVKAPSNRGRAILFEEYNSNDASYFNEMLNCAEGISPLDKRAEMYRALARISFLSDFETNQKFYDHVKDLIDSSDSTISGILLETMKLLAVKTIRITDEFHNHPELLLDLYAYDKVAGKKASENVAIYLCDKFGPECISVIQQIPDISLRSHAYLSILSMDISDVPNKTSMMMHIVPQFIDAINSTDILDEDLKNRLTESYEEIPEEAKTLTLAGEICIFYNHDNITRPQSIYIKIDDNSTMIDWKFIEDSEGDIVRKPISTNPKSAQVYLPRYAKLPDVFSTNITIGKWELAPDGVDCDFREETHNIYTCYHAYMLLRSEERTDKIVKNDQLKLVDNNSRRRVICDI